MTKKWYCHPKGHANDFFIFKEHDIEKHTTYYEIYFSIIPPFEEHDRCYLNIHNQYDVIEARIFISARTNNNKTFKTYMKSNVWDVRRQGTAELQRALYAVSKSTNYSGTFFSLTWHILGIK